jgi:hypothetical protein
MPLATDVNLPKDHIPIFPDRCVCCGRERPGGVFRIGTQAIGWWTLLSHFGPRFTAEVPACGACRVRMRRQRWLRFLISAAFVVAGVSIAMSLLKWYHGPFKKWLAMGITLIFLTPLILWETLFPPPVDLTAYAETVDYEFRDAEYAADFAELNQVEV